MTKEDNIIVPRWFLEVVENTLQIQNDINLDEKTGETCQDRNIRQSLNGVRKLLNGEELTGMERLEKLQPQLPIMDTVEKSNTPTSYGKYISEKCDEACELYYRSETDENRYSLADVFHAGVNAIRNIVEVVGVKESPLKTFPHVNQTVEDIKRICQIYDNLRVERDAATIAYNSDDAFWEHVLVTYKLSLPSLSSNLDEVAEEYAWGKEEPLSDDERLSFCFKPRTDAFKAGAEWMAGQGVILNLSIDELSCGAYNACVEQGLTSKDDVIVQIRKKQ